jgi:hypothetical protein
VAATGEGFTEAQVSALEKKQDDYAAHGKNETVHPGAPEGKTRSKLDHLRALVGCINKPLSTLTRSGLQPGCTQPKRQLRRRIYCMIESCHSLLNKERGYRFPD